MHFICQVASALKQITMQMPRRFQIWSKQSFKINLHATFLLDVTNEDGNSF